VRLSTDTYCSSSISECPVASAFTEISGSCMDGSRSPHKSSSGVISRVERCQHGAHGPYMRAACRRKVGPTRRRRPSRPRWVWKKKVCNMAPNFCIARTPIALSQISAVFPTANSRRRLNLFQFSHFLKRARAFSLCHNRSCWDRRCMRKRRDGLARASGSTISNPEPMGCGESQFAG
jgi:hypothetical protein